MRGIQDVETSAIDSGLNFTPRQVVSTFFSIKKAKKLDLKTRNPEIKKTLPTKRESLIEAFMSGALTRQQSQRVVTANSRFSSVWIETCRASQSSPNQSKPSWSESSPGWTTCRVRSQSAFSLGLSSCRGRHDSKTLHLESSNPGD